MTTVINTTPLYHKKQNCAIPKKKGKRKMKTYYIYDMQTNKEIGEIRAFSIVDAEVKYCVQFNKGSEDIYALSEKV